MQGVDHRPRWGKAWWAGVLLPALLAACGGWQPEPVPGTLPAANNAALLQRGHDLHLQKCAKCHLFVDPRRFTEDDWRARIMPEMAAKSELGEADAAAVLAYLLEVRKQAPP